jgi:hypothetical protein
MTKMWLKQTKLFRALCLAGVMGVTAIAAIAITATPGEEPDSTQAKNPWSKEATKASNPAAGGWQDGDPGYKFGLEQSGVDDGGAVDGETYLRDLAREAGRRDAKKMDAAWEKAKAAFSEAMDKANERAEAKAKEVAAKRAARKAKAAERAKKTVAAGNPKAVKVTVSPKVNKSLLLGKSKGEKTRAEKPGMDKAGIDKAQKAERGERLSRTA